MFKIVMSLEEGIPGEEFHQNAANTPDVTWEAPAQIQNNLRGSVVSSGYHGRVVFIVEGGWSEVD